MTENQSPETVPCKERALTIPKFREPYDVEENRLCICKTGSGGEHRQELCNFVPILEAVYTGKSYEITPAEALLGRFCRKDFWFPDMSGSCNIEGISLQFHW